MLTDDEKDDLVVLVRTTAQKLRGFPDGLRLFCSDDEVLNYVLDENVSWGAFLPIYFPSNLSSLIIKRRIGHEDRIFFIDGEPASLIERWWHILASYSQQQIRGCFHVRSNPSEHTAGEQFVDQSSGKLNILLGRRLTTSEDSAFNDCFDVLIARDNQTADLTIPFRPGKVPSGITQRFKNTLLGNEKKRRHSVLGYIENSLLKYYRPKSRGDFSGVVPPNNLLEDEAWYSSDFRNSRDAQLAKALQNVILRNQVGSLAERLNNYHVMIVGGFGSGSDFLARTALTDRAISTQGPGIFRVLQYAGTDSTSAALRELLSDDLSGRDTGLIFRDLLDPVTAIWPHDSDRYRLMTGFLHGSGVSLLHDTGVRDFFDQVRSQANYSNTRIIITSQYETLEELKFAVAKRRYAHDEFTITPETQVKAEVILQGFSEEAFWNPALSMTRSVMVDTTNALLGAWLSIEGKSIPRWLGTSPNQIEDLIQHGYIGGHYRIAAWCRIFLRILDIHSNVDDFREVQKAADSYASTVSKVFENLHAKTRLGIELGPIF